MADTQFGIQAAPTLSGNVIDLRPDALLLQRPVRVESISDTKHRPDPDRDHGDSVLLLAMAPITLFFLLTTSQYQFFKLLNVGVFIIAGVSGVVFLAQGMRIVTSNDDVEGARARRWVLWLWMIVYAFVGSQLAWTIRPFVGAPSIEFELFRQLGGNFYTNIFASLGEVLGFFIVQ